MVDFFNLNSKKILIGEILVDVLKSYSAPWESDITEHAVEAFDVVDHRRIRPQSVTMDCEFMDYDAGALGSLITSLISGTFSTDSWKDKRDRLKEEFQAGNIVDVTLPDEVVRMIIVSVNPDYRPATTNEFRFTIEMKEIITVQTQTLYVSRDDIPKSVEAKESDAQKEASKKKQEKLDKGTKKTTESSTKKKSILAGLFDGFGG